MLQQLGIAEAVKRKTTLVPGGYPAELVAKGEVELVAHQVSEFVPVEGVALVGPLPKDLQKVAWVPRATYKEKRQTVKTAGSR